MKYRLSLLIAVLFFTLSCEKNDFEPVPGIADPKSNSAVDTLHYLALGDSYTIGQGVKYSQNFPSQLATQVNTAFEDSKYVLPPHIIARTGWTAAQLLQEVEQENLRSTYDIVTLLIGVNNQYQGLPFSTFEEDYNTLLNIALEKTTGDDNRLILLSIPDYAYTPFGQSNSDPERISTEIDKYNAYIKQRALSLGVPFVNITDISREALEYPALLAPDNLHPSGQMYLRWVERMLPFVF